MSGCAKGDDADLRARNRGQQCDIAGLIGAHLQHRRVMARIELKQGQRQADVIIQIAARR